MTLEELECRAYANGDVEAAYLYGLAIDAESEKVLDLDYELRSAEEDIKRLEYKLEQCDCDD